MELQQLRCFNIGDSHLEVERERPTNDFIRCYNKMMRE